MRDYHSARLNWHFLVNTGNTKLAFTVFIHFYPLSYRLKSGVKHAGSRAWAPRAPDHSCAVGDKL